MPFNLPLGHFGPFFTPSIERLWLFQDLAAPRRKLHHDATCTSSFHGFEAKPRNRLAHFSKRDSLPLAYALSKHPDVEMCTPSCDLDHWQVSPAPDSSDLLVTRTSIPFA